MPRVPLRYAVEFDNGAQPIQTSFGSSTRHACLGAALDLAIVIGAATGCTNGVLASGAGLAGSAQQSAMMSA
jgi:hypothetical protein